MRNDFAKDGRVVIVTGGGMGLGAEITKAFAQRGHSVLIAGRTPGPLEEVAAEHESVATMVADVSEEGTGEALVAAALERWGRLDVVVNNAARLIPGPLQALTRDQLSEAFETNFFGPFEVSKAAIEPLTSSRGAIVNISSTFGHRPVADFGAYAASKAALEQLTRCWAIEMAPKGVRINSVAPGPTETGSLERESDLSADSVRELKRREAETIPVGRRGNPSEVVRWVLAFADPEATWITGQVLSVDGGYELVR